MGEEAEEVLLSTRITEAERKVYATVLEKLDSYFKVRKNVIFEYARFNRRHQQDGESAEQYIMEQFKLVEHCEYRALRDQMVRDRIVDHHLYPFLEQRNWMHYHLEFLDFV